MGFTLQDVLGSTLLQSVQGIISQFHLSPEDKLKLQAQLDAEKDQFITAEHDYNVKLNDIAGENIRAEASGGPYARNARPSVIWVGLYVIIWNFCGPLFLLQRWFLHTPIAPIDLPGWFWETWGAISLGYVVTRTAEKIMAMPGDSSIKLPFGIQVAQNAPKP
jgi:hypothetical protein